MCKVYFTFFADTHGLATAKHLPSAGLRVYHQLQRWPNFKPTPGQQLAFADAHDGTRSSRSKVSLCKEGVFTKPVLGQYRHTKLKGTICSLFKWADTALWLFRVKYWTINHRQVLRGDDTFPHHALVSAAAYHMTFWIPSDAYPASQLHQLCDWKQRVESIQQTWNIEPMLV